MNPFEALPYYRWHWRDYRANRKVQRMTYIERGLYRELLDECWVEGFLRDDLDALAEICDCPRDVMERSWPKVRVCFVEASPGALINPRMDKERTGKDAERAIKAVAGALGGSARAKAEAKHVLPIAEQVLSTCHIAVAGAEQEQEQEQKQEQESCAVPCGSTPPPAAVITLSLNDGSQFSIPQELLSEWISLFPAVQVMQELRNMRAWLDANPTRRKTKSGIKRFIVGWLTKEQNNPNSIRGRSTVYDSGTNTGSARTQRNRAALNAVKQRNQARFGSTEGPNRGDGDGNN